MLIITLSSQQYSRKKKTFSKIVQRGNQLKLMVHPGRLLICHISHLWLTFSSRMLPLPTLRKFRQICNSYSLNFSYLVKFAFYPSVTTGSSIWQANATVRQLYFKVIKQKHSEERVIITRLRYKIHFPSAVIKCSERKFLVCLTRNYGHIQPLSHLAYK